MGRTPSPLSASVQKYGLSYIRPYHREIARRLVLGETQREICEALGMSDSRMSIIVNSPLFKLELSRLEKERDQGVSDVTTQLKHLAPIALEQVERTMYKAAGTRLGFDAARDILDRAGYSPVNKVAVAGRIEIDTENMQDSELVRLLKERIMRKMQSAEEESQELMEASTAEVEYDKVCSQDEHSSNNIPKFLNIG